MTKTTLHSAVRDMYERQLFNWPLYQANIAQLNASPCRDIEPAEGGFHAKKILLSYRKASLTADIGKINRGERPCFLCPAARPVEQESFRWRGYDILLNPYPATPCHLTIVSINHVPQNITGRIDDMVALARLLPDHCIFYNGPKCGASAPDHQHFQAVDISLAKNYMGNTLSHLPFGCLFADVKNDESPCEAFDDMISHLKPEHDGEPMMNILAFSLDADTVRIVVVPRRNHRPACYGCDEGKMLVSPASIEMMGTIITSRETDFDNLDGSILKEIYRDVAYTDKDLI